MDITTMDANFRKALLVVIAEIIIDSFIRTYLFYLFKLLPSSEQDENEILENITAANKNSFFIMSLSFKFLNHTPSSS